MQSERSENCVTADTDRVQHFAQKTATRAQSELKSPNELIGACALLVAGTLAPETGEAQLNDFLNRFNDTVRQAWRIIAGKLEN